MPYILNKTNGVKLLTVDDGAADVSTSLTFVGRNYSGYGEIVNENFLKLLESSANTSAPAKPIQGQLWFDATSTRQQLHVCYDGKSFKTLANLFIQSTTPVTTIRGDLWWDSQNDQLKAWNGTLFQLIGPPTSRSSKSSWDFTEEAGKADVNTYHPIIKGRISTNVVAVVSEEEFNPLDASELASRFDTIKRGITLAGANTSTGVSSVSGADGYIFWGTAANALTANTAATLDVMPATTGTYYLPLLGTATGAGLPVSSDTELSYDSSTNILSATALAARYADLAERYAADDTYEEGTVVVIGGDYEVTVTNECASTAVAGIVSRNPAYMMNSEAGSDQTHPYIALKGRVPCKIVGQVNMGDLLVTSVHPGYACAWQPGDSPNAVIGKALRSQSEGFGFIEVLVV
jgi:hypothetical protein